MRVLGMMSGTSLDAIDVALVDFTRDPADPSVLEARLVHLGEEPWPAATRDALRAVLPPAPADVANRWRSWPLMSPVAVARRARTSASSVDSVTSVTLSLAPSWLVSVHSRWPDARS